MASAFGHGILAASLGVGMRNHPRRALIISMGVLCSIFPDVDVLAFRFGIPYGHIWGHRGMTHSLFFGLIAGMGLAMMIHRRDTYKNRLGIFYTLCFWSHGILDAMTTGGKGIAFFAPFEAKRYFLPWRMIKVSPLSVNHFFSEWGLKVMKSELYYIWGPSLVIAIILYLLTRKK